MAGTIVVDRLESDASYASSINIASPLVVSNTINMTGGSITGNVNFDSGTLFVDAVNNRVGIGTQNPVVGLQVTNPSGGGQIRVVSSGGNILQLISDSTEASIRAVAGVPLTFRTSNEERMNIDASGRVTMPSQPSFHAFPTSSWSIGSNGVNSSPFTGSNFSAVEWNIGSHFNTSNARFTAPVTGIYSFTFCVYASNDPGTVLEAKLFVNGQEYRRFYNRSGNNINNESAMITSLIDLSAGDYVQPGVFSDGSFDVGGNQSSNSVHYTFFEGFLIG